MKIRWKNKKCSNLESVTIIRIERIENGFEEKNNKSSRVLETKALLMITLNRKIYIAIEFKLANTEEIL